MQAKDFTGQFANWPSGRPPDCRFLVCMAGSPLVQSKGTRLQ
jgi:hypothetical protein